MSYLSTPKNLSTKLSPTHQKSYMKLKASLKKVIPIQYHSKLRDHEDLVSLLNHQESEYEARRFHNDPNQYTQDPSPTHSLLELSPDSPTAIYSSFERIDTVETAASASKHKKPSKKIQPVQTDSRSKEIAKVKKSLQAEFNSMYEKTVRRLKAEHKKALEKKQQELEEVYNAEISLVRKESEAKLKLLLIQSCAEVERVNKRIQDENGMLKKEAEGLRRQLSDVNAKYEVAKSKLVAFLNPKNLKDSDTEASCACGNAHKEKAEAIARYNELQRDYLELKRKTSSALCVKCKAFTMVDMALNSKIATIRSFINNN